MEAPSSRSRGARGAAVGAVVALVTVGFGVLGLVVYEWFTGGAFFDERGGGSVTTVAQFVLLATPLAAAAAAVLVPVGAVVGWAAARGFARDVAASSRSDQGAQH